MRRAVPFWDHPAPLRVPQRGPEHRKPRLRTLSQTPPNRFPEDQFSKRNNVSLPGRTGIPFVLLRHLNKTLVEHPPPVNTPASRMGDHRLPMPEHVRTAVRTICPKTKAASRTAVPGGKMRSSALLHHHRPINPPRIRRWPRIKPLLHSPVQRQCGAGIHHQAHFRPSRINSANASR